MNQRDDLTLSDEVLGAYLDGELSGVQRARVEQLLAEDASRRQTLEDLQALSGEMQSLPRYQLGQDFHLRVLERAGLAEPDGLPSRTLAQTGESAGVSEADLAGPARGGRSFLYVALAIAAAVLLMFFSQEGRNRSGVATGPGDPQSRSNVVDGRGPETGALVAAPDSAGSDTGASSTSVSDLAGREPGAGEGAAGGGSEGAVGRGSLASSDLVRAEGTGERAVSGQKPDDASKADPTRRRGTEGAANLAQAGPGARGSVTNSEGASAGRPGPDENRSMAEATEPAVSELAELRGPGRAVTGSEPGRKPADDVIVRVDEQGKIQYLFIVEVDLTVEGTRAKRFTNALRAQGIRFEADLQVDGPLQRALLESRMLARAEAPRDRQPSPSELVYVVGTGYQIDSAIRDLATSGQVSRLRYDVGFKSAQVEVFDRLRLADSAARRQQADLAATAGRARRLMWEMAVLSPTVRQLAGQTLLTSDPKDVQGLLPRRPAQTNDQRPVPGADQTFEVLFLVRRSL